MNNFLKKSSIFLLASCFGACLVSCSDDEGKNSDNESEFSDKSYGQMAVSACANTVSQLESANEVIGKANLSAEQEEYLRASLANIVDNVIVPTYTELADKATALEAYLNGLNVSSITQSDINNACNSFADARVFWEQSEAFLGGAASDFSIDPTIDSWPLSRTLLHNYLSSGKMDEEMLDDSSILGFHALEFMLFRNGQPRKVAEFQGKDSYPGFTDIDGSKELLYAQQVCKLLKERTYQLQVAWEGETASNASRVSVLKAAGLDYKTEKGISFGDDLKGAGTNSKSRYASLKDAVAQVLSDEEGSAAAIANEVGTAKIANPFSKGQISYVESPYSYRSIKDFTDNIRSVRNIWYGTRNGKAESNVKSFYNFFASVSGGPAVNDAVVSAFSSAIDKISDMPEPFVKYCCTVWNKVFSDEEYMGEE